MTYVALGFRHLVFHAPGNDQERFLELYGKHVLAKLRSKASAVSAAGVVAA
jgi:coenzyme F420-dependent glucose-6-phosphate dehydrogenase